MCDIIAVVRADGVLFAKNSDRDPNEAQLLQWHPAATHPSGGRVRCTWIEIEQAPRTHAVLLSRPFWMWGAEMGTNEHGVTIGNEAVFTTEPYADTGLTGMDLLRLGLERGATAEAAVATITDLLERYGQGGGCGHEDRSFTYHNSYVVADPERAYVLETAGRRWALERVGSGARSISNGLTIEGFAQRHGDRLRTRVSACRTRRAITEEHGRRAAGPAELAAALRDHGPGDDGPRYRLHNGAMAAPCMHAGGLVASSQTTASWVADLRPGRVRHWATATAAPCTGLFKPVRVDTPLDLGPAPTDRYDPRALWWRHELLHRVVMQEPTALLARYAAERDDLERGWFADPPAPDEAFAAAGTALTRWTEDVNRQVAVDVRPPWVRPYWRRRDERAGMPRVAVAV